MVLPLPGIDVPVDIDPQPGLMTETWYNYFRVQQQLAQQLQQQLTQQLEQIGELEEQIEALEEQIEELLAVPAVPARELLTGATTIYVRSDGTNDGSVPNADSVAGAFPDWQTALDHACARYDFQGFDVTIKRGLGGSDTFTDGMILNTTWTGGGSIIIDGVASAYTHISTPSGGTPIYLAGAIPGGFVVQNIKLSTAGGDCIRHTAIGNLAIGNDVDFGFCTVAHIEAHHTGVVVSILGSTYSIHGSAAAVGHIWAHSGAAIYHEYSTCNIYDTPTFAAFAQANTNGVIQSFGSTFVGAATGYRFVCSTGGQIFTGQPPDSYFPGTGYSEDLTSFGNQS